MEARKITIVQTKNQKKSVIMSSATTLAELKNDLRANDIDYDGMTFFEGTSKVELINNDSVLPHDVPYKGTVTNELVFMLTNTNKKIRSGAMSRAEAYSKIKSMGLGELCKEKYGKNFTQCSTNDLIALIEANEIHQQAHECPRAKMFNEVVKETSKGNLEGAFEALVSELYDNDCLGEEQYSRIMAIFKGEKYEAPEKMSQKEIDEMFSFVK
jgi:hypothetical protein